MRLIDADALIAKCGNWYTEEGTEEGFIGALKSLLDKQPTIEPEPHWIPVTEQLPEEGVAVLVTDDAGGITTVEVDFMDRYEDTGELFWYTSQNVMAWLPLPVPWNGDGNA